MKKCKLLLFCAVFLFLLFSHCAGNKKIESQDSVAVALDSSKTDTTQTAEAIPETAIIDCKPGYEENAFFNKIQDTLLRKVLYCFEVKELPFYANIQSEENAKPIANSSVLKKYFFNENDEQIGNDQSAMPANSYFSGYVFEKGNKTFGVILHRHYYPGAFGIDNMFSEYFEFDYSGKQLKQKTLGCNCMDSNMGANEILTGSDSIVVYADSASVYTVNTRDELMQASEEEGIPGVEYSEKRDTSAIKF